MQLLNFLTFQGVGSIVMVCVAIGVVCFNFFFNYKWARFIAYGAYAIGILILLALWGFPITEKRFKFYSLLLLFGAALFENVLLLHKNKAAVYPKERLLIPVGKTIVALIPVYALFMRPWQPLIFITGISCYALLLLVYGIFRNDHAMRLLSYSLFGLKTIILLTRIPSIYSIHPLYWYYVFIPVSSLISVGNAAYLVYAYQDRFETQERRYAFGYCMFLMLITAYSWLVVVVTRLLGRETYSGPGFLKPFFGRSMRAQWSSKRVNVQGVLGLGSVFLAVLASLGSLFDKSRLLYYASVLFWSFFSWHCYQLIKKNAWTAFGATFIAGLTLFIVADWFRHYWKRKKH